MRTSPDQQRRHPLLAGVAAFNALSAGLGAVSLIIGWLTLGATVTGRLPFASAAVGGIALGVIVALPNALLTVVVLRRDSRSGPLAIVAGILLVGWIVVELAFIREFSFFHPFYTTIGLLQVALGLRIVRASTGITGRELLREVVDVLVDLPVFLTSPLYRRWHLTWGATQEESLAPMLGDERIQRPAYRSTRAITVQASPEQVWPWLVQVGCQRAGFYSDDLLDNLGRPSSRILVPELQQLELGQLVPMSPQPTETTSFKVAAYDAPHELLWTTPDSTWSWRLVEESPGRTRMVTRIRAVHDWSRPAMGLLSLVLLEFGDFAMLRRMLRGIKERAENSPRDNDP